MSDAPIIIVSEHFVPHVPPTIIPTRRTDASTNSSASGREARRATDSEHRLWLRPLPSVDVSIVPMGSRTETGSARGNPNANRDGNATNADAHSSVEVVAEGSAEQHQDQSPLATREVSLSSTIPQSANQRRQQPNPSISSRSPRDASEHLENEEYSSAFLSPWRPIPPQQHPQPTPSANTPRATPDSPAMNTRRLKRAREPVDGITDERPASPSSSQNDAAAGLDGDTAIAGADRRSAKREAVQIDPDGSARQANNRTPPQQPAEPNADIINVDTFEYESQPPRNRPRLVTSDQPVDVERRAGARSENDQEEVAIVEENIVRRRNRSAHEPVAIQLGAGPVRPSVPVPNGTPIMNGIQADQPLAAAGTNPGDDDIIIVSVTRAPRDPAAQGTAGIRGPPWERIPYLANQRQPFPFRTDDLSSESESDGDYDDEDAMGDDSDEDGPFGHLMDDADSDHYLSEEDNVPLRRARHDRLSTQARDREVLRGYEQWPEPRVMQPSTLPRNTGLQAFGHGSGNRHYRDGYWQHLHVHTPTRARAPRRAPRTISTSPLGNGGVNEASPPQRDEGAAGLYRLIDRIRYYAPQWMANGPTRIAPLGHHGIDYHAAMMRLGERASYEQLLGLDRFLPNKKGASDSVIQNIPTVAATKDDETEKCTICLEEMKEGVQIKRLPCNSKHIFHPDCIDRWLKQNGVCPIDKRRVDEAARTAANGAKTGPSASRPPRPAARTNQTTAGPSGQQRGESSRGRAASGGALAGVTTTVTVAAARSRAAASTGVVLPQQSANDDSSQQRQPTSRRRRRV